LPCARPRLVSDGRMSIKISATAIHPVQRITVENTDTTHIDFQYPQADRYPCNGTYDLLRELKTHKGKYLYLEIKYQHVP
jgi:hypothetical protein